MDDLVAELRCVRRNGAWGAARPRALHAHPLCVKAADTIQSQAAELATLRAELAEAREAALEEAAKVARDYGSKAKTRGWSTAPDSAAKAAQHIASNIRALKGPAQ